MTRKMRQGTKADVRGEDEDDDENEDENETKTGHRRVGGRALYRW